MDDRRQVVLRIAEPFEQARDAIERKVVTFRMQRHQAVDFEVGEKGCHRSPRPATGRIMPGQE
jgi:hypothetical protein